jgi:predicted esterase
MIAIQNPMMFIVTIGSTIDGFQGSAAPGVSLPTGEGISSAAMPTALRRTIRATTTGAYLVSLPDSPRAAPLLVGFHGYGQNAEACMADLQRLPGSSAFVLVAVQALHRFYDVRHREVVGSWMTKLDREQAIRDNLGYVGTVLAALSREGDGRLVYLGFSQGASMAYRAAAYAGVRARGVIALAGDMPPEMGEDPSLSLPPVLIGRGGRDEWYTEEKLAHDLERLRARGTEVEVARFSGGHEWTEDFCTEAASFLERVLPRP